MVGKSHYRVRGVKCGKCDRVHTWYKYRVWREGSRVKEEYIGKCDKSGKKMHSKTSSKQQRSNQQNSGYKRSYQESYTYTYPQRKRSPYEILGISYFATNDEIKRAYRTLVKQYHPDLNRHIDPRMIVEINTAYHILMK